MITYPHKKDPISWPSTTPANPSNVESLVLRCATCDEPIIIERMSSEDDHLRLDLTPHICK